MDFTLNRTDRQSDQIRIILKTLLQSRVVTSISRQLVAAGNLKRARQPENNFAIPLTVELDLAGFVAAALLLAWTPWLLGRRTVGRPVPAAATSSATGSP